MKTAVVIFHVDFEKLGTLESLLVDRGYKIEYVDATLDNLATIDIGRADLVMVLGGPNGAFDEELYPFLDDELALVHRCLKAATPLIGICLGAQLVARALGAPVRSLGVKEIGFEPITLTAEGRRSALSALGEVSVLHWHGDQFDIPTGALRLAFTSVGQNQAFSLGEFILGLQFHLEADAQRIEQWLVGNYTELAGARVDPRIVRTQAQQFGGQLALAAHAAVGAWLQRVEALRESGVSSNLPIVPSAG